MTTSVPSPDTPASSPIPATAAVLVIGDEILSGRTKDQNIAVLAKFLRTHGLDLIEVRIIPDHTKTIKDTVNGLRARADLVICTGGIGPTHDDRTAASIAQAFSQPLIEHDEALAAMQAYYESRGQDLNEGRRKMATVPEGASLITNPLTIAPGFKIGNVIALAGVPSIMQAMLEGVIPYLPAGAPPRSITVRCDLPESVIAAALAQIDDHWPAVTIGSYPKDPAGDILQVDVVLTSREADSLAKACQEAEDKISALGGTPRVLES
ncbi:MAG: molybdopterin-binding protein [Pseudomonadota bacterium]